MKKISDNVFECETQEEEDYISTVVMEKSSLGTILQHDIVQDYLKNDRVRVCMADDPFFEYAAKLIKLPILDMYVYFR